MKSMRTYAHGAATALFLAVALAPAVRAEPRLLTFVFGPTSQETARQGAHAAASAARHWLQTSGADVELRLAGNRDAQPITAGMPGKELDDAFAKAALAARDADPQTFLTSLETAVQAAGQHAGARVVVAVLNSPPFSSEGEHALEQLVEVCRAKGVRVLVMDLAGGSKAPPKTALAALATRTGGMWFGQAKALEPDLMVASEAASEEPPAGPGTQPTAPEVAAAQGAPKTPGVIPQFEIPIKIRFIRTSGKGSVASSLLDATETGYNNAELTDLTYLPNEAIQPMQGILTAEAPLNALKFETNGDAGTYQAHARLVVTVRNSKGASVWSFKKDFNIHGPAAKLDARRQGNMFFMRWVTLPGHEHYTLEAKVEDLLGGTAGLYQTPLQTGQDAPGLVASDALAVRPYRGAVDKFEADQVFSYDGDALAPVLDPVFRAEKPINLQLYLVLYPDLHGDLPDLSMEILRGGQVVGRMPLQFKSGLAKSSTEGKFATMQGYGVAGAAIVGSTVKEFPYLADVKGAKFTAGNYEAVVYIRQGKKLIKRSVAFRVEGKAPMLVASAGGGGVRVPVDEDAGAVLPEIEPASVDSSGLKMRPAEQKALWDEAAKNAMGYLAHLPNFRCTQETRRFTAPVKTPDQLKEADSFKSEIIYEDGKERYQTVEVNGAKVDSQAAVTKGIYSRSEFGSMLRGLFDPDTAAQYKWTGRAMAMGVLCEVFDVDVARDKSNFVLRQGGRREPAGYHGRVFIDEESGMVRRLTIEGVGLPEDFGLKSPALSLDYGLVRIGKDDHLLPLRSVLQLRHFKAFVRNETVFTRYRKFAAESELNFDN